jgi:ssDNA thymidine ADP-ribosyltransferase, DarT
MLPPARPKIYHIAHVDRLAAIIAAGGLFCDRRARQESSGTVIGMGEIKDRRLTLPVHCHPEHASAIMSRSIFVPDRLCCS